MLEIGRQVMTGKHRNYYRGPRVERIKIKCEVCNKVFEITPGRLRARGKVRFCSRKCMATGFTKPNSHTILQCSLCGKGMTKRTDKVKSKNYCSIECRGKARRVPGAKWKDKKYIHDYQKRYSKSHRWRRLKTNALWISKNKRKILNIKKKYRQTHKDEIAALAHSRRTRIKEVKFSVAEWKGIKAFYNYTCLCCGRGEPEILLTPDHIHPLVKGGLNCKENIQPLCGSCNSSKGTKTIDYRTQVKSF